MKKPIVVVAAVLLIFSARLSLAQVAPVCPNGMASVPGYGCLAIVVSLQQKNSCKTTGGSIMDAFGSIEQQGMQKLSACMCPKDTVYHIPSKTCVTIGRGSLPQTVQPAKRVN
jgi:hypothetical protein